MMWFCLFIAVVVLFCCGSVWHKIDKFLEKEEEDKAARQKAKEDFLDMSGKVLMYQNRYEDAQESIKQLKYDNDRLSKINVDKTEKCKAALAENERYVDEITELEDKVSLLEAKREELENVILLQERERDELREALEEEKERSGAAVGMPPEMAADMANILNYNGTSAGQA